MLFLKTSPDPNLDLFFEIEIRLDPKMAGSGTSLIKTSLIFQTKKIQTSLFFLSFKLAGCVNPVKCNKFKKIFFFFKEYKIAECVSKHIFTFI